jgi:hypothetical protein
MKSIVFWVLTPYSSERAGTFGETYRLYLQARKISEARNLKNSRLPASVGFLVGLLVDNQNARLPPHPFVPPKKRRRRDTPVRRDAVMYK